VTVVVVVVVGQCTAVLTSLNDKKELTLAKRDERLRSWSNFSANLSTN
jgi:hypothetical protein